MNMNASLFAFASPLQKLHRFLHPYSYTTDIKLDDKQFTVKWTERAQLALRQRLDPLTVEMQLYFSCLVKKRVLFHDKVPDGAHAINDHLAMVFRATQATSCDPVEFARHYPIERQFENPAISKVKPSLLLLDYVDGSWQGEFSV